MQTRARRGGRAHPTRWPPPCGSRGRSGVSRHGGGRPRPPRLRDPEEAQPLPGRRRAARPAERCPGCAEACELILAHVARGSRIAVSRRLRRGRRLLHGHPGAGPARARRRSRLGDPEPLRRRLRPVGGHRRAAGRRAAWACWSPWTAGSPRSSEVAAARAAGLDVVVTDHHRPGAELPDCPVVHPAPGRLPVPRAVRGRAWRSSSPRRLRVGGRPRPGGGGGGPRPGRARDRLRPRAAARREPPHRAGGPGRAGPHPQPGAAGADGGGRGGRRPSVAEHALGFRLGPAHQRRRAHAARRRRARAAAHRGRRPAPPRWRASSTCSTATAARPRPGSCSPPRARARRRRSAGRDRGGGGGVAPGRGRDRGLAAGRALAPAVRRDRARRRTARARLGPQHLRRTTFTPGSAPAPTHLTRFGGHRMAAGVELAGGRASSPSGARSPPTRAARCRPEDLIPVRARGRGGARRRARARAGRGARAPAAVRHGQPAAQPARARRARSRTWPAMGEERQHARFTLVTAGGSRSRGVAFGSPPASLGWPPTEPHDIALRLERNRWNGVVEPRIGPARAVRHAGPAGCARWARTARSGSASARCWMRGTPAPTPRRPRGTRAARPARRAASRASRAS